MADTTPPSPTPPRSPKSSTEPSTKASNDVTLRQKFGNVLSAISDTINSNLIIIRYGTLGSIVLLGAYGIANTPLFYRYKSLWDIPESMWRRRRWVHGRIIGVVENNHTTSYGLVSDNRGRGLSSLLSTSIQKDVSSNQLDFSTPETNDSPSANSDATKLQPVVILFRHSSPVERLLTQNAMDKVLALTGKSPSRMFYSSTNPNKHLLPIELAGISHHPMISCMPSERLINKLAKDKTRVSIQLLAQRANASSLNSQERIPEENGCTAVCQVTYKKPNQWFNTTNVSLELVTSGQALISPCVVPESDNTDDKKHKNSTTIINFNPSPKQLQQDAKFISQLEEAEYAAWKSKTGIWSLDKMRELRPEYTEEERYVSTLLSTKVWNILKIGLGWIRR